MNIENLKKYYDWTEENLKDRKINMMMLNKGDNSSKDSENICGTAACFLGYAPLCFGVDDSDYDDKEFDYDLFCDRVFSIAFDATECDWLFGSFWPNCLEQARKRLKMLIDGEMPEYSEWCNYGYQI